MIVFLVSFFHYFGSWTWTLILIKKPSVISDRYYVVQKHAKCKKKSDHRVFQNWDFQNFAYVNNLAGIRLPRRPVKNCFSYVSPITHSTIYKKNYVRRYGELCENPPFLNFFFCKIDFLLGQPGPLKKLKKIENIEKIKRIKKINTP